MVKAGESKSARSVVNSEKRAIWTEVENKKTKQKNKTKLISDLATMLR